MKTNRGNKKGGLGKKLIHWTGLVALSLAVMISCQKKDSSNANYIAPLPYAPGPGAIGNCVGCGITNTVFGQPTSQGSASFPITINWNLLGDPAAIQQLAAYGQSAKNYSGPISVTGTMNVAAPIMLGGGGYYGGYGCQIPAGLYQLASLQVGNMTTGMFTIPQFEAVAAGGVSRVIFSLNQGVVVDPAAMGTIAHVVGQLIPIATFVNGAQMTCSDPGVYLSY